MIAFIATILFLIVHTPGGQEIEVNIAQISSLHEPRDDPLTTAGAECLIFMTNGRFISAKETCKQIADAILATGNKMGWPK